MNVPQHAEPPCEALSTDHLLERLVAAFRCPQCKASMSAPLHSYLAGAPAIPPSEATPVQVACPRCQHPVTCKARQVIAQAFAEAELTADPLQRLKEDARRQLGKWYGLAVDLISPVQTTTFLKEFLQRFDLRQQLVADLGAGSRYYSEPVLCVDGGPYDSVHLVADLAHLPLADESLDGLVSVAVLEHVDDPQAHVAEMGRVLAPGGTLLCYVPFLQGFHAAPYDFQRLTAPGLRRLFADFDIEDIRIGAGPTSAMLWTVQEWLALVLSFGSRRAYRLLLPLMWSLSPLKLLDKLLVHHPDAGNIASAFVVIARKASS